MNYYNEFEKYPAQWLRNLIDKRHIPVGLVDERSIIDVEPSHLENYTQCHFFAGIGGWSYALRLSGWPEDRPVWTGSCPCQPFSVAGKGKGVYDSRHLWPAFRWLISQCKPSVIFGEQVASKAGREWLAGVRSDLEAMGYEVGCADLCAAGVGAPHIRQRLFWVAHSTMQRHKNKLERPYESIKTNKQWEATVPRRSSANSGMGDTLIERPQRRIEREERQGELSAWTTGAWSNYTLIPCADGKQRRIEPRIMPLAHGVPKRVGAIKAYGNAIVPQIAAVFISAAMEALKIEEGWRDEKKA